LDKKGDFHSFLYIFSFEFSPFGRISREFPRKLTRFWVGVSTVSGISANVGVIAVAGVPAVACVPDVASVPLVPDAGLPVLLASLVLLAFQLLLSSLLFDISS
jgi:hypothetical protein